MKKKIVAMLSAVTMLTAAMPAGLAGTASSEADYYARNFMATDNNVFWEGCAQISWFNPAEKPEKVELYALCPQQTDGNYVLVGDDFDTTANASVVTTLPTKNWSVYSRPAWYNFKLVSTFAGGKVSEQTIDYYVPTDATYNADVWTIKTDVSDDFMMSVQRGGWCYSQGAGQDYDIFPMKTEIVYDNGNPALKVWSNAHISDGETETRDGKTDTSGNYYGQLFLKTQVEKDETYDIFFRYKTKGIEKAYFNGNDKEEYKSVEDTNGEWKTYSNTFTAKKDGYLFNIELKKGNEEIIIDDIVLKKTGTDSNLVTDGDFSKIAAGAPADVVKAEQSISNGTVTLKWKDSSTANGVNIYKVSGDEEIKIAYVRNTKQTLIVKNDGSMFVAKAVNGYGAESAGVYFTDAKVHEYDVAATDPTATSARKSGHLMITWKNPDLSDINSVTLSDASGNEVGTYSTEAGAFCSQLIGGLTDYTYYTYKLTIETESGQKSEQYISGTPIPMDTNTWGTSAPITSKVDIYRHRDNVISGIHPEVITENGNKYLKVQNENVTGTQYSYGFIRPKVTLEADTQYTLSYKVKGSLPSWAKIWIYDGTTTCRQEWAGSGGIVTFNDWTTKTHTFTTPSTKSTRNIDFEINGVTNGLPVYMDDIVLKKGDETIYTEDFETSEISYPMSLSGVSVTEKDDSAVLSWTAPGMDDEMPKVVRIWAECDGCRYLAATLPPDADSCEIENLNGKYTFLLDIMTEEGYKSAPVSVTALIAPKYEVSTPAIINASGKDVSAENIAAGTYTVKATVKNNAAGKDFNSQIIVALYDGDVFVSSATSDETTVNEGKTKIISSKSITVPDTTGHNYRVKAFVWSSLSGMKPLCQDVEFFK